MEFNRPQYASEEEFTRPVVSSTQQRRSVSPQSAKIQEKLPPCLFSLNNQPMSKFICDGKPYDAFSGLKGNINKIDSVCTAEEGAIPPGTYFIVERKSGGRLGWLYDAIGGQDEWFALYANDDSVDDITFCNKVRRGEFRLHPKGPRGISKGCITIERESDFFVIRKTLLSAKKFPIPSLPSTLAYGTVIVK